MLKFYSKYLIVVLVIILCGCQGRKRRVYALPTDQPITIKVEEPERFLSRIEEITFYIVILISFVGTVIHAIRFEINKYKNNNDIDKMKDDLRNVTAAIGERNSTRRQQEFRREREIINNIKRNNGSTSKIYSNKDNHMVTDDELETLINNNNNNDN
jgi:hypothetical protein